MTGSHAAFSVGEAVQRLNADDGTLHRIDLTIFGRVFSAAELRQLAAALVARPHIVKEVVLGFQAMTDDVGVELARYLSLSTTIELLRLNDNLLGELTALAVAAALRYNRSLRVLEMFGNDMPMCSYRPALVEALWLNPARPPSVWHIRRLFDNEYDGLRQCAALRWHPSLYVLLRHCVFRADPFIWR